MSDEQIDPVVKALMRAKYSDRELKRIARIVKEKPETRQQFKKCELAAILELAAENPDVPL